MKAFYQISGEEALKTLHSSPTGLTKEAVADLQIKFGDNMLQEARQKSRWAILLSQFADVMIIILVIAATISFAVGEHTDAMVILAIILGNAWMGYSQEYNAEKSVRMLQKMSAQHALVLRSNHPIKIEAKELVPGDIVLLEAGDIVPADGRLLQVSSLKTEEASLTGESHSIEKNATDLPDAGLVPGDQLNMVFKGTIVSNGTAKFLVTATGMQTELGKIAGMLEIEESKTPLQKRLAVFSKQLAVIVLLICAAVFGIGLWRGEEAFGMFLTALSLAVAALPEALPAVITIALAQGARRMVLQKALMRKLPAVETLGSVTYICSDKTGTLTQNVMTVEKLHVAEHKEDLLKHAMILNNEVRFSEDGLLGDSTETALVEHAIAQGHSKETSDNDYPQIATVPFDSQRMRMSTLHEHDGKWIMFVKGAPKKLVEALDTVHQEQAVEWLNINRQWAGEGLRVLFFAYKEYEQNPGDLKAEDENNLHLLGMAAMIDPPREEVIEAISQCKTAGIKSVMITGDQPITAKAIALRLGMVEADYDGVQTGADLEKLSGEAFSEVVRHTKIYARVSPAQKLNIVKALQSNGEFVAMTGDGVNDAPSLKQADIGVAMGITGTDVSKEAADMILLDDNFATLVKAVKEGRRIYENIRKFILYVLSCNLGEILTIFFAPFLGFAIPLLPIQVLWINLVTDGLPGLALVAEPAEKDIMKLSPRPPKENLFAGGMVKKILMTGAILAIASLLIQWWGIRQGFDVKTQHTLVFTTLCFVQLGNALSVRSAYHSMFSGGLLANKALWGAILLTVLLQMLIVYVPFLQPIFKTTALGVSSMTAISVVTIASILAIELLKLLTRTRLPGRTGPL